MSIITKASAKAYFTTGAYPTQGQFADTIDSYLGLGETALQAVSGPVAFFAKVSAKAGMETTVVSANSVYTSTVIVSGASITGVKGSTAIVASVSGNVTNGNVATWDATGNLVDGGGVIAYNTYTPTITSITNIDATTAHVCNYVRIGNQVIVNGRVDIDPTASNAYTELGISLPIASDITSTDDLAGTGSSVLGTIYGTWGFGGDVANNRADVFGVPTGNANQGMSFTFGYKIN